MNIKEKIVSFFEKIFNKKEEPKLINKPIEVEKQEDKKKNFVNSIKVNKIKNKQSKVETLICDGDGLGIKKKVSY